MSTDAGGARLARRIAIAACAVAAAGALLWAAHRSRDGMEESSASLDEEVRRALLGERDEQARVSSVPGFLDDLDELSRDADGPVAVRVDDAGGLVALAGDVLDEYREAADANVVTSGYLDLKGNAWGALVECGSDWVDVVTVMEDAEGMGTARVVRMSPRGLGEPPGGTDG